LENKVKTVSSSLIFIMETSSEDTLHITQVLDLTYFSRSQRSNFDNFYDVLQLLNYWADLNQIFILHTSNKNTSHITRVFHLNYFSRSQRSNFEILQSAPTP
jgi:hypothetical protein